MRKAYEKLNLKSVRTKTKIRKIKKIKDTIVKHINIPKGDFKISKPNKYGFININYIKAKSKL